MNELVIEAVQKLELHPGDTLVLKMEHPPLPTSLDTFRRQLCTHLGFKVLVIVLGVDESVEVVTRPGGT